MHAYSREFEQDRQGVVPKQSKDGYLLRSRVPFVRRDNHSNWWQDLQSVLYEIT